MLLGGGIGEQSHLLLEPVRAAVATLVPYSPDIGVGTLGDHAVLTGATRWGGAGPRSAMIRRCLKAA